jgi:hypothetical protein
VTLSRFFSIIIPLLLLSVSFWRAGIHSLYLESRMVQRRAVAAQSRLEALQALSVASRIDQKKYDDLVVEFADLTGLRLGTEFAVSKGEVSAQVARFVDAIVEGLREEQFSLAEEPNYLLFRSVAPGQRQALEPFLSVDFEINLEGRFFALPRFLLMLTRIAQEQKCAISIGELQVARASEFGNTGELSITLPLRAYFLER